uniref:AIG1-type G domain-containing protein n=1 Tax=Cyprinus carpio TaxID=7962 RepID=A0A8C1VEF0_CYPCA
MMTDSILHDALDTSKETEGENSNVMPNPDIKDDDKETCNLVKREVSAETCHTQPCSSQDQSSITEENKETGEKRNNSKPNDHPDLSEAHQPCDSDSSCRTMDPSLTIVLNGNSSSIKFGHENILLTQKQTNMENAEISRIVAVQKEISEHHVSVINMIDFHETEHVDHLIDQLVNENEIHAFIFVVRLGQLTDDDKMGLEWLQRVFGDKVLQFVMILFTYEREEECDTIIDDLRKNPVLKQLLEKCGERFQTCNKMMNNQSEMRGLMKMIEHLFNENQQQCYTGDIYNTSLRQKEELENTESGDKGTRIEDKWTSETVENQKVSALI